MAQSLAKIILHVVFSTRNREARLGDKALRDELHHYLGGILKRLDCMPLQVGGIEDHVHLLFVMARTRTVADVVKELKRGSTLWWNERQPAAIPFAWQNGYGVFSLGMSQVEAARAYVEGQEEHHRTLSFQDEFRELLRRYGLEADERYLWD